VQSTESLSGKSLNLQPETDKYSAVLQSGNYDESEKQRGTAVLL